MPYTRHLDGQNVLVATKMSQEMDLAQKLTCTLGLFEVGNLLYRNLPRSLAVFSSHYNAIGSLENFLTSSSPSQETSSDGIAHLPKSLESTKAAVDGGRARRHAGWDSRDAESAPLDFGAADCCQSFLIRRVVA